MKINLYEADFWGRGFILFFFICNGSRIFRKPLNLLDMKLQREGSKKKVGKENVENAARVPIAISVSSQCKLQFQVRKRFSSSGSLKNLTKLSFLPSSFLSFFPSKIYRR